MPKNLRDHDDDKDVMFFSDTSSSISADYEDERDRKRRRKKKSHRRNDDDDSRRHKSRRHSDKKRKKKHSRSRKTDKKKKDHKRRKDDDSDGSSSHDTQSYGEESNRSENSRRRRRRHQKHSKKERKRRRKEHDDNDQYDDKKMGKREKKSRKDAEDSSNVKPSDRSRKVALALHNLFMEKPEFASELPIILIRLAGGTTFDLSQVTDASIARGLESIFKSLEVFGVKQQEENGLWGFENPPGASRRDELILLKMIRTLLDDVGLSMDEITKIENEQRLMREKEERKETRIEATSFKERDNIREMAMKVLQQFVPKVSSLASELVMICKAMLDGESVGIDGIEDKDLVSMAESLFNACGLEKSEIEYDDEEEDGGEAEMGYGLPDEGSPNYERARDNLATIIASCQEWPPKRKSIGPMRMPSTAEEEHAANELYAAKNRQNPKDEDDEGPLLPGEARKSRGPAMSQEMIKAQAEHRELQLKATAAGVAMPTQTGGREEWMIVPGQHDFLSSIKSDQAIKSRGFQNKKSRGDDNTPVVNPAVKAEMDAIMEAHENARGPSLFDLHRSKKSREKELASRNSNGKKEWKWSRDKDLDAGRRVDKEALGMIMGGAANDLKEKFAGGFNR